MMRHNAGHSNLHTMQYQTTLTLERFYIEHVTEKNRRRSKIISSIKTFKNKAIFVLVLGMDMLSVLSIIFGSVHSFCFLIIFQYLKNKPLGMQTLLDLILVDVSLFYNLIIVWIFNIIINVPTEPDYSHNFVIILSGNLCA